MVAVGRHWDWTIPGVFILCMGWTIWHIPAFLLDLIPPKNPSLYDQISELHERKDIIPGLSGPFGGFADSIDWLAAIMIPVLFVIGVRGVRVTQMEYQDWRPVDRVALFIGRVTMVLIISMTTVMLYEVFLRYAVERPTLWANELTLWIAGFVFLCSGLYAMQQRCHIRIFLLYDVVPRWLQRTFDTIWTASVVVFAAFLIYGSYHQVFAIKFYRWEMFGTAFDPPIPATVQPAILILVTLIALQSIANLVSDWNLDSKAHAAGSDVDEDEIEAIRHALENR